MSVYGRAPYSVDPYSGASGTGGSTCCDCRAGENCCACVTYSTLRREWNFTIAGIANSACSSCSNYNGTFELHWVEAAGAETVCRWRDWRSSLPGCHLPPTATQDVACLPHYTWELTYEPSGTDGAGYYLYPNLKTDTAARPYYFLVSGSWSCTGSNVMNFVDQGAGECLNTSYPATVTLTPSPEVVRECECDPPFDVIATTWKATFSGVTDGTCGGCTNLNTDITLQRTVNRCQWEGTVSLTAPCAALTISFKVDAYYGISYLDVSGIGRQYYLSLLSFNPVGGNTYAILPLAGGQSCGLPISGQCLTYPATITVAPL